MEQDRNGDSESMIIQPDRPVIIDCKFPYLPVPDTYINQLKEIIKEDINLHGKWNLWGKECPICNRKTLGHYSLAHLIANEHKDGIVLNNTFTRKLSGKQSKNSFAPIICSSCGMTFIIEHPHKSRKEMPIHIYDGYKIKQTMDSMSPSDIEPF